jgi:hypothetical protein
MQSARLKKNVVSNLGITVIYVYGRYGGTSHVAGKIKLLRFKIFMKASRQFLQPKLSK